jgi:hypothetical protein
VVGLCIILPLRTGSFSTLSRVTVGVGFVLVCFTPPIIAGHYRLFSRTGRTIYDDRPDYPRLTGQEAFITAIAVLAAGRRTLCYSGRLRGSVFRL